MRTVKGFSLIELLIVIAIILIIMGMALDPLKQAKMQALEAGAIKAVQTIHTAQAQYQSQYGKFAPALLNLGPPASGLPTAAAASLISGDLATGVRSGYKYNLQPTEDGYTVTARPVTFNSTGRRSFYSDDSLALRQSSTIDPATAESPEVQAR
jgi:prepilin-type N-terminal cleavage/methylation domain-containing protein